MTYPPKARESASSSLPEDLSSSVHGLLVAGPDRRIRFCNDVFTQITGFDAADVIGERLDFNCAIDADGRMFAQIERALCNETVFSGRVPLHSARGDAWWGDVTIFPRHDEHGRLVNFVGIYRDVTLQLKAEDALIAATERQVFLLDCIQAGIVIQSPTMEILFANAAATKMLRLSHDRTPGVPGTDPRWAFICEDGSPMPLADHPVNRAISSRSAVSNVLVGLPHSSVEPPTWLTCNAYPVLDESGVPSEVVVSFMDVTELKLAEHALRHSDERLRLVLQGSNDAPWDWDVTTDARYYSPRWWQMLGFDVDELPSDFTLWPRLVHPDDDVRASLHLREAMNTGATSFEMEFRLCRKDGRYVPVLSRGFILRDDAGNPIRVSGTNTDLSERKAVEEQINRLAFYDALTLLPNRRLLMEQLQKALFSSARSRRCGALLFIDLDNFKVLNDTMGHERGDQLLKQVAARLRGCVREADTVARLGGDEFVVMLEHLPASAGDAAIEAESIGKKILETLDVPYILAGQEHCSTASIGIALFADGEQRVDVLLQQADLAMYQAKAMGRNRLRNFDASMQTAVDDRLALETDLRKSFANDEMMLYYQAQVSESGGVVGAEVLLRWQHSVRGLVMPASFIALAEATGLILPIGDWVLRNACRQLAIWESDPVFGKLSLSVNVSVRQFREPDFATDTLAIIAQSGADPRKLRLEMTESLLAENIDDIIEKMAQLKAHGVTFSLDDFGTGYSSLRYLQRLPLDELKIDRMFVSDVLTNTNDATIARAIITLAENLGLSVIAEGVETDAQQRFLAENGCRSYQGYLFGKPVPLVTFEAALRH